MESANALQVHRQTILARWAAFAILAWMFLPLCTGRVYVCDDLLNYHLPIRQFYAECLKQGDAFDWMPSLFSGFFLTGSGQAGTYHPWHWLLYRFLPLPTAFNLEILSAYPFMLFGMKLFLQRHLQRSDAAWLGAIVFAFSGFCTLHFLHPNAIAVVSHLPWLLLAHDLLLRPDAADGKRRIVAETGIAVLTGSQLLLGYPQYVWYSLIAESIYCLGFSVRTRQVLRTFALIALLKAFGLALGAVQILPSMEALSASDRMAMPVEYFSRDPLSPLDMLQWIGPFLTKTRVFGTNTHELGVYCGALPVLLALVAVWRVRRRADHARLVRTMIILGLVSLWLSFGKPGGLYVVQTWLPLVGKFRWPSRIIVLMHLVLAVLAAVGYVKLTTPQKSDTFQLPRILLLVPVGSVLSSLGLFFLSSPQAVAPLSLLATGPVLFLLAFLMVRDLAHGKSSAVLMLFVAGDLAAYGFTYEALSKTQTMEQILSGLETPPGKPDDGRVIAETLFADGSTKFHGNDLLLAGWRQADGYEGLLPRTGLLGEQVSIDGLRISGVRWIVNSDGNSTLKGVRSTVDARWLEVPDPLPRVRMTTHVRRIENPVEATARVSASGPVIVDRDVPVQGSEDNSRSVAKLLLDRPGQIEIDTKTDMTNLLVLAERYSSAWKITVDGLPVSVVRSEVDFMGCVVPAGHHTVKFSFEPASLRTGRLVSVVAVMLLLAYVAFALIILPSIILPKKLVAK
jgi:hypothetical protein